MSPTARRRYDWPSVKMVFVEGTVDDDGERTWPNLREVAELFDVPYVRVREHSAKGTWRDERTAFMANIERVRQDRRAKSLAQDSLDMDKRALQLARTGMQLAAARLAEIGKAVAEQQRAEQERPTDTLSGRQPLPAVDARELSTLIGAAESAYALGQKALGEVAIQRLEISGPGGLPVQTQHDVRAELRQDDPDRLAKFLLAAERAGLVGVTGAVALGATSTTALDTEPREPLEGGFSEDPAG